MLQHLKKNLVYKERTWHENRKESRKNINEERRLSNSGLHFIYSGQPDPVNFIGNGNCTEHGLQNYAATAYMYYGN